jgi:RHS repeat-associated protein
MTHPLNKILKNKMYLFTLLLTSFSQIILGQVTGTTNVETNSIHRYEYNDGLAYPYPNWVILGGSQVTTGSSGTNYYVDIQWSAVGIGSVTFRDKTRVKGTLSNIVISAPLPQISGLSNENYVLTVTPTIASTSTSSLSNTQKITSVSYFDGLGRPMQKVSIRAGANSEDIITHIEYDEFGRQAMDYLPYAATSNVGLYRTDALTANNSFYNTLKYENTLNPFSEKHFESSPLNRVLEQGAPGADWAVNKTSDADHTIKFDYQTNAANEVLRFEINFPGGDTSEPELQLPDSYYEPGQLYKTVTKDENWKTYDGKDHTTEEFKDKLGRIILKRTYNNQKPHSTYYVYDDFGNLTYVIPPLASEKVDFYNVGLTTLSASAITTSGNATGQLQLGIEQTGTNTYRYAANFDLHNLENSSFVYSMELPFAHESVSGYLGGISISGNGTLGYAYRYVSFSAYNGLLNMYNGGYTSSDYNGDPLVISDLVQTNYIYLPQTLQGITEAQTQANLQEVLDDLCYQYKYDSRNRLIEKKIPGKDLEYIVYNKLDQPVLTQDTNLKENDEWLLTKYDAFGRVAYTGSMNLNYSRLTLQGLADGNTYTQWETRQTSSNTVGDATMYYSSTAIPNGVTKAYTINYYDDYIDLPTGLGNTATTYYGLTSTTKTKGLLTVNKVKVLTTSHWITNVTYYDSKARPIYTYTTNPYLGTTDITEIKLDFTGNALETKTTHKRTGQTDIVIFDSFEYDHVGRLISQKQNINGQGEELIAKNHYDELGQLVKKDVGDSESNPLQEIDYTYNIRGWLKELNNPNWGELGDDLFTFRIGYNDLGTRLYNGNISQVEWTTSNDEYYRRYNYSYDDLNRLINASFYEWNKNSRFNVYLNYDKNGNISSLNRRGAIVENPDYDLVSDYGIMDNLSYTYQGNQLMQVSDSGSNLTGFKDGNTSGYDYVYDANGNMVKDLNKGIGDATTNGITYNHLNLPTSISINGNGNVGTISYIYDATGVKLKKTLSTGTNTLYAGNYIYEGASGNETLKFFNHPEGYIDASGSGYEHVYQYKDHLGNVRLSYKENSNFQEIAFWEDGFETATGWDNLGSSTGWGSPVSAYDTSLVRTGSYSGRLDPNQSNSSSTATLYNTWQPININEPTYFTVSAWVYLEDVTDNFAGLWLFMNTNNETGYATELSTTSTRTRGQWVQLKKAVLVQPYIDKLNVRIDNRYAGKVWFDDVKITKGNASRTEILEENNYYPFGLRHKGYNNVVNGTHHPYTYNGKEEQEELGLNWHDFGARNYDASLGRWMNVDPLAEKYPSISPYAYVANNPIFYVDPDGREIKTHRETAEDGTVTVVVTFTGKLINNSSTEYTPEQLQGIVDRMVTGFQEAYTGEGETVKWKGVANITVAAEDNPLTETDHAIRLYDNGKLPDSKRPGKTRPEGVIGHAPEGEKVIEINTYIAEKDYVNRTFPHEAGHSGYMHKEKGVYTVHPADKSSRPGNLMHQTSNPNSGMKLDQDQILQLEKDYKAGSLNKGRQKIK